MSADFEWTPRKDQAADLVAQDHQTDTAIATACGVTQRTLERWKQHLTFQERVAERRAAYRAEIEALGIADKRNREAGMVARHQLLEQVRQARAHAYRKAPGGETGLVVGKIALVKVYEGDDEAPDHDDSDETLFSAKRYRAVWEYSLDGGLLTEMRNLEKHIAQERGEWVTKQALTNSKGEDVDLAAIVLSARQPAKAEAE